MEREELVKAPLFLILSIGLIGPISPIRPIRPQAEKPVHEFGRKVLSLQNENFKCNMVMPAPGAGRAL